MHFCSWFNPPRDSKGGTINWPRCLCKCRFVDDSAVTIFDTYYLLFVLDLPDRSFMTRTMFDYHTTQWLRPQLERLFPPLNARHYVPANAYAVSRARARIPTFDIGPWRSLNWSERVGQSA